MIMRNDAIFSWAAYEMSYIVLLLRALSEHRSSSTSTFKQEFIFPGPLREQCRCPPFMPFETDEQTGTHNVYGHLNRGSP